MEVKCGGGSDHSFSSLFAGKDGPSGHIMPCGCDILMEFDLAGFERLYRFPSFNCIWTWMEVLMYPTTHCLQDSGLSPSLFQLSHFSN